MLGKKRMFAAVAMGTTILLSLPSLTVAATSKVTAKPAKESREQCYQCHDEVKALKEGSKHTAVTCSACHSDLAKHVESQGDVTPVTKIDAVVCGNCHKDQYDSFRKVNYEATARKEKGVPAGRSPMQDKLLAGHGFTFEHNEPRGHLFMVIDQFAVDRFQGGRFQFKEGWKGLDATGKAWDVLIDTHKKLPETAMAGNPTCIQCKTSDHILKWKFMGDKGGKWDRTSEVVEMAKDTQSPVGCIHCHDPHGTQSRVVRDALIQAIADDPEQNIFAKGGKTDLKEIDFRGFRKIGVMQKADSRLMCAQCHVEYACNTGTQWSDAKRVGYDDQRTNHFPLKNAKQLLEHYRKIDFYDFKHAITGARLIKLQHPEAETYAGSVHDRAGVQCHQCHMPKQKRKDGKTFSNHGVIRPRNHIKEACLGCHPKATVDQKLYQIDAIQNYTKGKMRKAEYWLGQLIDSYVTAQRAGVAEELLTKGREKHEEAHVLWEFWTAENSDGFHNPDLARDALTASIAASKEGVTLLNKAIGEKTGPSKTASGSK